MLITLLYYLHKQIIFKEEINGQDVCPDDLYHLSKPIKEKEPTEEEARIFKAYHDGDPEYQPFMTHEDLMQELELE